MRAILAIVGGCLLIVEAFVLRIRFGNKEHFRAAFLAGAAVLMIGIFDSGILYGKAGVAIGVSYMVALLATGFVFARQSRREWREKKQREG